MNTGFVRPAIAIVLTACGIETCLNQIQLSELVIAIVLTACGIETHTWPSQHLYNIHLIAIVLTACGIETQ